MIDKASENLENKRNEGALIVAQPNYGSKVPG